MHALGQLIHRRQNRGMRTLAFITRQKRSQLYKLCGHAVQTVQRKRSQLGIHSDSSCFAVQGLLLWAIHLE